MPAHCRFTAPSGGNSYTPMPSAPTNSPSVSSSVAITSPRRRQPRNRSTTSSRFTSSAGREPRAQQVVGGGAGGCAVAAVAEIGERRRRRAGIGRDSAVDVGVVGEQPAREDERRAVDDAQAKELPVLGAARVEVAAALGHGEHLPAR